MDRLAEYQTVVDDLALVLQAEEESLVLAYTGEANPLDLDFIFDPPPAMDRSGETFVSPDSRNRESGEQPPDSMGERARGGGEARTPLLEANVRCTLCQDRMFPVKRFRRAGTVPLLVLHYNGGMQDATVRRDRSDRFILGGEEEDDLFRRMVGAAGWSMDELHFQEYPGCFFDPGRSMPEDWNDRCRNCLTHVEDTLRLHSIRLLILTGPAAIFLLGEELAKKYSLSGDVIPLPFSDREVPAVVLRSPAALIAYEKKRLALKGLEKPEEREKYAKIVAEEKAVKNTVLATLKRVRQEYL